MTSELSNDVVKNLTKALMIFDFHRCAMFSTLLCSGIVVITTARLHSTKPELTFLLVAYWRFARLRISDNGPDWK